MTDHEHRTTWFLAQLKPNSARIAQMHLDRQGFQTLLPLEERTSQRNGRFTTAMKPLFPGYIFVAFDPAHGLWRKINATTGVTRLVSFGNEPAPVPTAIIHQLLARDETLETNQFSAGDVVTMTTGPFANAIAEIEDTAPDRRVWVLIDLMGRKTRVAVDTEQLRAV